MVSRTTTRTAVVLFALGLVLCSLLRASSGSPGRLATPWLRSSPPEPFAHLDASLPETRWVTGVAGFNYFTNLYSRNGVFIVVTSDPTHLPVQGPGYIMSGPVSEDNNVPAAGEDRWMILDPEMALHVLGGVAVHKRGTSMWFNDTPGQNLPSFLNLYFHFVVELFLGGWRAIAAAGERDLPARIMFRSDADDWRDDAQQTAWFQQAVLPSTAIEEHSTYVDRAETSLTYLFDKLVVVDRWAAHRHGQETQVWNKATCDLPLLRVPTDWWKPLRDSMRRLVVADGCHLSRSKSNAPVVTYISRQLTGRRLVSSDHDRLVGALKRMDRDGLIEFEEAKMETMSRTQQFCLALRTDIMLGVHGTGLSHQLWMKPNSGVLEIMREPGFVRDYALVAELMGHEYYAVHNDHVFPPNQWRKADGSTAELPPDFDGSTIRVDADFVSGLVKKMAGARKNVVEPRLD